MSSQIVYITGDDSLWPQKVLKIFTTTFVITSNLRHVIINDMFDGTFVMTVIANVLATTSETLLSQIYMFVSSFL